MFFRAAEPPPSHHHFAQQDKVEEYADEIFDLLDNGAHMYFCGLKGMMPGIQVRGVAGRCRA